MVLLRERNLATIRLMVVASLQVELSLFCDAFRAVTLLVEVGAPVLHYAIEKLGSLALVVGLDTCYAFNTIAGSLWVVLPAHIVWLHRKSTSTHRDFSNPTDEDVQAADTIGRLWKTQSYQGMKGDWHKGKL